MEGMMDKLFQQADLKPQEQEYLKAAFSRIPRSETMFVRNLTKRLLSKNPSNRQGACFELLGYDWLANLPKDVRPEPKLPDSGSVPEFLIMSETPSNIYVEVVAVGQRPLTISDAINLQKSTTRELKKMRGRLVEKLTQHSIPEGSGYVIMIFLRSQLLGWDDIKTEFLGNTAETFNRQTLAYIANVPMFDGQLFERDDTSEIYLKHKSVSGLLVAYQYGNYMHEFQVAYIENPYAISPIPQIEFGLLRRFVIVSGTQDNVSMQWIYPDD